MWFPFRSKKSETISMLLTQLEDTRQELNIETARRIAQDKRIEDLTARAERAEEQAERFHVEREELSKSITELNAKLIDRMSKPEQATPISEFTKEFKTKHAELTRRVHPVRKMWKDALRNTIAAQLKKSEPQDKPDTSLEASMEALAPETLLQ